MVFKKSTLTAKGKTLDLKNKAEAAATNFFEKAKTLFSLDKRADVATERAWETYISNRAAAERRFRGPRGKRSKSAMNEDGESSHEDYKDDEECGDFGETNALDLIRCNMATLEEEMGLDEGVLSKSFRVLSCDALFEEEDEVTSFCVSLVFIMIWLNDVASHNEHPDANLFSNSTCLHGCPLQLSLSITLLLYRVVLLLGFQNLQSPWDQ
jgi:hypothetical protein